MPLEDYKVKLRKRSLKIDSIQKAKTFILSRTKLEFWQEHEREGIVKLDISLSKPPKTSGKNCDASIYEHVDQKQPTATGTYSNDVHAELNALVNFINMGKSLESIQRIEVTSPPCTCCAFLLFLLRILDDKVKTTGNICKHPGGTWRWPPPLRDIENFYPFRWNQLKEPFLGSGLNEKEILMNIVQVVETLTDHGLLLTEKEQK